MKIKKKRVACGKKRRRRTRPRDRFASDISRVLDALAKDYATSDTENAAHYSAVTVVAGVFVWAVHNGFPPRMLTTVMSEALDFALRSMGLHPAIMIEPETTDPKEVN